MRKHRHQDPSWLEPVRAWLATESAVEPSVELDRRVRDLLFDSTAPPRPFSRPGLAAALAASGWMALTAALAGALAQAGAAESALPLAVGFALGYVGLGAAVSLPVLLSSRSRPLAGSKEVVT